MTNPGTAPKLMSGGQPGEKAQPDRSHQPFELIAHVIAQPDADAQPSIDLRTSQFGDFFIKTIEAVRLATALPV